MATQTGSNYVVNFKVEGSTTPGTAATGGAAAAGVSAAIVSGLGAEQPAINAADATTPLRIMNVRRSTPSGTRSGTSESSGRNDFDVTGPELIDDSLF
jgi:hypothetical protein